MAIHRVYTLQNGATSQSLTQRLCTVLDTSRSYLFTFSFYPYQLRKGKGCSIKVYANEEQIFNREVNIFYDTVHYESLTSPAFKPSSPDVTIRMQYQCASISTVYSVVLVDDVLLVPS